MPRSFTSFLAAGLLLALASWLLAAGPARAELQSEEPLHNPRALLVKSLVEDAAHHIAEQGELAFADFHVQDSKWRQGEIYIFVLTIDGFSVVNPPSPQVEHKDLIDLVDVNFKPIVRDMIREVSGPSGEGWTHYMWPKPGGKEPVWKSSFVKRVTSPVGFDYIVGCGAYNLEMERAFIEDQVRDAVNLIRVHGKPAFDIIRDSSKEFLFRDTYIFITDEHGNEIVDPAFPIMEGKNLLHIQDADGKFLVREYLLVAKKQGEGWVRYRWLKPGANEPVTKDTFVKGIKLGDTQYIVGSGIYQR